MMPRQLVGLIVLTLELNALWVMWPRVHEALVNLGLAG